MKVLAITVCVAVTSAVEVAVSQNAKHFNYKRMDVGDYKPPQIPRKDGHPSLEGESGLPLPSWAASEDLALIQTGEDPAGATGPVPGLRDAISPIGSKVPAGWFGRGKYLGPNWEIASGKLECDVCQYMINKFSQDATKQKEEFIFPGTEPGAAPAPAAKPSPAPGSPPPAGKKFKKLVQNIDLCDGINPKHAEMCSGFEEYLASCPSFTHDVCHSDVGGTEELRSPCPDYLKCYYCLRINPLYCIDK